MEGSRTPVHGRVETQDYMFYFILATRSPQLRLPRGLILTTYGQPTFGPGFRPWGSLCVITISPAAATFCSLPPMLIKIINIQPKLLPGLGAPTYSGRVCSLPLSCVLCLICLIHLIRLIPLTCLISLSLQYLVIKLININSKSLPALGDPTYSGRAIYDLSYAKGNTQVSLWLTMEGSRTPVHGRVETQDYMFYFILATRSPQLRLPRGLILTTYGQPTFGPGLRPWGSLCVITISPATATFRSYLNVLQFNKNIKTTLVCVSLCSL